MTTPAVLYDTVPLNLDCLDDDDSSAIHELNLNPNPKQQASSAPPNEEDEGEEAYDTIFEDDDDFVLVPTSVQVPSEEWVEVVQDDPSSSNRSSSMAWFSSSRLLPDRVGNAAKSGVEWLVTTKTRWHRRMIIAAHEASAPTQPTCAYPWATSLMEESSTTVTSEIHGEVCRLMLPGPVVVFGAADAADASSMCAVTTVSLTGDEVMRPQVMASSKPTTRVIMVSAYDILAASSHTSSPITSLSRSRILESSFSGMLMNVIHYSGTKIVKSTKKHTQKIVKAGGTVVQSVGHTIVRLERRFQVIGKASDLLLDGYERFLGPLLPNALFDDGEYTTQAAIELTS